MRLENLKILFILFQCSIFTNLRIKDITVNNNQNDKRKAFDLTMISKLIESSKTGKNTEEVFFRRLIYAEYMHVSYTVTWQERDRTRRALIRIFKFFLGPSKSENELILFIVHSKMEVFRYLERISFRNN